jgi:uncharacterized protein (DUF1810 family)
VSEAFDLERFRAAQEREGTYGRALAELRDGRKRSHWMWFVLPQIEGLGSSSTAQAYAIRSLDEARAYVRDPLLGARLTECARALLDARPASAREILGAIDALKLRSCMTLFEAADPAQPLFGAVLDAFFAGERDPLTVTLLQGG